MPGEGEPLAGLVRRGAGWVLAGQIASQFISLATLAGLYRLVAREEFGLFGMALVWVMPLRTLATLGLSAAAVQRREMSADDRAAIFWLQTAVGILVMLLALAIARPAAWWYGVPEVGPLIFALAATVLIASLSATHQALLERRLALGRVTFIRLLGQIVGAAAALIAAWRGWGADALVVQQYGELLALLVAVYLVDPWWPRWPRRDAMNLWREVASFGGFYSLSSLLFVCAQQIDKLLLGLWLGQTPAGQAVVGAYTQAYQLLMRPVYLVTTPASGVLLPALARVQTDAAAFASLTGGALRLTSILLFPASFGLALVAEELLVVIGGEAWRDAGRLLAILAPIIAVQGWINLCGSIWAARGQARLLAFGSLVVLLITAQSVAAGFFFGQHLRGEPFGGAYGMAWGLTFATVALLAAPYLIACLITSGVPWRPIFFAALRPLRASLLMGLIVALAGRAIGDALPPLARLGLLIALGVIAYILLAASELRWLLANRK
jgi:O-antigen/teichoic acid export membrane protein